MGARDWRPRRVCLIRNRRVQRESHRTTARRDRAPTNQPTLYPQPTNPTPLHPTNPTPLTTVYDYEYSSRERGAFSKIVFVHWAPDGATTKAKMMYAATKDFFKGFLDGIGAELQANEPAELSEEELRSRVAGNLTRK